MTCNGCRSSVEEKLRKVDGVTHAVVNLEKAEAVLDTEYEIPITELKNALSDKYNIIKKEEHTILETVLSRSDVNIHKKSKLQELRPLLLILGYIISASILLHYKNWNGTEVMLDFMGLFYIVFSFFKILDLKGFPASFRMYDPLAKVFPVYGWIYPFIETALGLLFLMRFQITLALISTLIILGLTTFGVARTLLNKRKIQCACLGTALKLPMTEATLIENTIMIGMAIGLLVEFL